MNARALDNDDYDGVCGSGRFPLIGTVSKIVRGRSAPDSSPTTSDTTTQTSNGEEEAFMCPGDDGFFENPSDCGRIQGM